MAPNTTVETAEQKLARVMAENEALKAQVANSRPIGKLTYKVSQPRKPGTIDSKDKGSNGGAICIFGINSRPVTLYKEQLLRLLADADNAKKFIADNEKSLSVKAEQKAA